MCLCDMCVGPGSNLACVAKLAISAHTTDDLSAGLSTDLGNVAASVAATAATSSATAGTSGAPTATSTTPAATTPEVTATSILLAEVSSALTTTAQGLAQASLELIQSLGQVPELQASMDGTTGIERQKFVSARNEWDSFVSVMSAQQACYTRPVILLSATVIVFVAPSGAVCCASRHVPCTLPIFLTCMTGVYNGNTCQEHTHDASCVATVQNTREAHLEEIRVSMAELLSQITALSSALEDASKSALLQTLSANMNSLQLVLDDSFAANSLYTHLASALGSSAQTQVCLPDLILPSVADG